MIGEVMQMRDALSIARSMLRSMAREDDGQWTADEWEDAIKSFLSTVRDEESAYRLGEVLRLDRELDLPVRIVRATYHRLFELGATDARTRLCYARYSLLYGPEWDDEAHAIIAEVETAAKVGGFWDSPALGHHPVFYAGMPGESIVRGNPVADELS